MVNFIKKHWKLLLSLIVWTAVAVPFCYWMAVASIIYGSVWSITWFYYCIVMPMGCLVILIIWGEA